MEKTKIIKDIRMYISEIENIDGNAHPTYFNNKLLKTIVNRLMMKLNEKNFSLGEYSHLYLNFTTFPVNEKSAISKRAIDRYHPWFRYYDINIDSELFNNLENEKCIDEIINLIKELFIKHFVTEEFDATFFTSCFNEVLELGENMMVVYKKKVTTKREAILYLKYLNNCNYLPVLKVFDLDENLLFEKDCNGYYIISITIFFYYYIPSSYKVAVFLPRFLDIYVALSANS